MILVAGATGDLGGRITRGLLGRGEAVRILVRPGREVAELVALGAEPVTGDLKDAGSLAPACEGADVVVTTANSALRGGEDTVETVDRQGNRALIDAAAAAGAGRFVFVSAFGAGPHSPLEFLRAKGETEEHLRASGIPATILQPDLFMEVWIPAVVLGPALAGQPVVVVGEGTRKHSFVSAADVAAFAVAAVDHPEPRDRVIPIGGPQALSWRDVVGEMERMLGRSLEVQSVAPGTDVPGLIPVILELLTATDLYDSVIDMDEPCRTFGVRLTPVAEALAPLMA
jgi:NADH dehydrogenase